MEDDEKRDDDLDAFIAFQMATGRGPFNRKPSGSAGCCGPGCVMMLLSLPVIMMVSGVSAAVRRTAAQNISAEQPAQEENA